MAMSKSKNWSVYNFVKITQPHDSTDSGTRERYYSLRHNSQWEELIRKISESPNAATENRRPSNMKKLSIPKVKRSEKIFPTGSSYKGTWTILGMSGYGVYTFPTGAVYEGHFEDGMFHGPGKLSYPNGTDILGTWERGELKGKQLIFIDGVEYKERDWKYANKPDRRYQVEQLHGLQPAGRSHISAETSRDIPPGFYDTGDGYYVPEFKSVCSYKDHSKFIRTPGQDEQEWILQNCRKGPNNSIGPAPELYEVFYEATETKDPTVFAIGNVMEAKTELESESEDAVRWQKAKDKSLGFTEWAQYHRAGASKRGSDDEATQAQYQPTIDLSLANSYE